MDTILLKEISTKILLAFVVSLVLYWIYTAAKLVISARGINPLIKQFFTQVASARIDAAYLLTTKSYRQHVNRQQFIRFLAGLQLNKYRNLKSGRPRIQEGRSFSWLNSSLRPEMSYHWILRLQRLTKFGR